MYTYQIYHGKIFIQISIEISLGRFYMYDEYTFLKLCGPKQYEILHLHNIILFSVSFDPDFVQVYTNNIPL